MKRRGGKPSTSKLGSGSTFFAYHEGQFTVLDKMRGAATLELSDLGEEAFHWSYHWDLVACTPLLSWSALLARLNAFVECKLTT